jgi:hypothetical protein
MPGACAICGTTRPPRSKLRYRSFQVLGPKGCATGEWRQILLCLPCLRQLPEVEPAPTTAARNS